MAKGNWRGQLSKKRQLTNSHLFINPLRNPIVSDASATQGCKRLRGVTQTARERAPLWWQDILFTSPTLPICGHRCHASSNRCLTSSNKKLLETSATLIYFEVRNSGASRRPPVGDSRSSWSTDAPGVRIRPEESRCKVRDAEPTGDHGVSPANRLAFGPV